MRLIHESTFKRNLAQGRISLKHVLRSQFDPTPHHKCVWGVPECAPEGARKVRFAALHDRAEIRDEYATSDMPVDMVEYLPSLPCQQTLFSVVRTLFRGLRVHLPAQQRGCFNYRAVRRLFVVKLSNGRIQQGYYMVHPVPRSPLTDLQTDLPLADFSLHC
jgi:hypothetical protein